MTEKRKYPRQPVELRASLQVDGMDGVIESAVKDMSIGGMFFYTDHKLPFGTHVKAFVAFPQPLGVMEIPAVVRWFDDAGVGLQFGLLGARETHAIAQVLRKKK